MYIQLTDQASVQDVRAELQGLGLWTRPMTGAAGAVIGLDVASHSMAVAQPTILAVPGVADVIDVPSAHPRVDAQWGEPIQVGDRSIGGGAPPVLISGPCSVESPAQIQAAAATAARAGASLLRGGAFKPRTSPYCFDGHGRQALGWLREAADAYGLGVVTEVMSELEVQAVAAHAELLQLGARNMQNYALLRAVGGARKPVLLKRGMSATVEEWLLSAEHLLKHGATGVIFCERGIAGGDPSTRYLLDLAAVALLKHVYGQPVIVDPSHATGRRDLVPAMARAALAAGADGLLVEAHPDARQARSDGPQALDSAALLALGDALGFRPAAPRPKHAPTEVAA